MASSRTANSRRARGLGDHRALQIIVAVDTHRVGVHRPAVHDPRESGELPRHQRLSVARRAVERGAHRRVRLGEIEALARLQPDPLHLGDDRLVRHMRRLQLQDLGRVGEVFPGRHGVDLLLGRGLHVDARVELGDGGQGGLAPLRQRRDLEAGLDLADGVVIRRPVGLGAADDPDIGGRRVDPGDAIRHRSGPTGRRHQEIARLRAGGAPARRGEHVGPHVEHRQHVIAPAGVGGRDHHRPLGQIEPGAGVERVEIRPHDDLHVGGRIRADIGEGVHRPLNRGRRRPAIGELAPRQVHRDERVEIKVGVDGDRVRLLLADRLGGPRCRRDAGRKSAGKNSGPGQSPGSSSTADHTSSCERQKTPRSFSTTITAAARGSWQSGEVRSRRSPGSTPLSRGAFWVQRSC